MGITPRVGQQGDNAVGSNPPANTYSNQGNSVPNNTGQVQPQQAQGQQQYAESNTKLVGGLWHQRSAKGTQYMKFNINFARSKDQELNAPDVQQRIADAMFGNGANFVAFENKKKVTGDKAPDFWVYIDIAKV